MPRDCDAQPHLLALHLLNTDGVHHALRPRLARELYRARAGRQLCGPGGLGAFFIAHSCRDHSFVLADHGFANATNILQPNVLLRQAGLLKSGPESNHACASAGDPGRRFGNGVSENPATRDQDRKKVLELFANREGIGEIVEPDVFTVFTTRISCADKSNGMADLVIAAKNGYGINGSAAGDDYVVPAGREMNVGYHGDLTTNARMDVPFVGWTGIKRGVKIGAIRISTSPDDRKF